MCHVLIIEDEFLIADYIAQILQDHGATSIAQAMTQDAAVNEALSQRPDVILSDVKLLEGTGPLAVEAILRAYGRIPVIFITGTPEACQPCHADAIVVGKPIDEREMIRHFRNLAPV